MQTRVALETATYCTQGGGQKVAEDLLYMEGVVAALMSDKETDEEDTTVWKVTDIIKKRQGALEERLTYNSKLAHGRVTSGVVSLREVPNGINPMYLKGI
ncbi:hypothetical protein AMECASPLE_036441 [Ameca splendens]|uniref:Uncharacterized protein n=1 Tax=Ameca splendens TaxID=208324 RepID=A0ABV1AGN3_9TELE